MYKFLPFGNSVIDINPDRSIALMGVSSSSNNGEDLTIS